MLNLDLLDKPSFADKAIRNGFDFYQKLDEIEIGDQGCHAGMINVTALIEVGFEIGHKGDHWQVTQWFAHPHPAGIGADKDIAKLAKTSTVWAGIHSILEDMAKNDPEFRQMIYRLVYEQAEFA